MPKRMKGTNKKTGKPEIRDVQDCFVRSYVSEGWVEIPPVIDGKPNPEFINAKPAALREPRGKGPTFSAALAGSPEAAAAAATAEAGAKDAPAPPAPKKPETAKDRAEADGKAAGK